MSIVKPHDVKATIDALEAARRIFQSSIDRDMLIVSELSKAISLLIEGGAA